MEQVKALRELTGAGIVDVKKALDEAGGDENTAIDLLRKKGKSKAVKKADRVAREGVIGYYVHSNRKIGAIVKVMCETDFVARNANFIAFANDLAMHITASAPVCVRPEDVDAAEVAHQREIWKEQLAAEGKPAAMMEKILDGKEKKFRAEMALLTQPFVRDPEKTVEDLLNELVGKIGEKIAIGEFARFSF